MAFRIRWRAPDDLGAALVAFGRALRAHCRLARLAPRFFDSAVVDRERRQREAQRRWMAQWEPALAKAYGTDPPPLPDPAADLPPLPPPRTQRAVERALALRKSWLATGYLALERHRRRRPHALVSLSRVTRLLEVGFDLARLACGADSNLSDSEPDFDNHEQAMADLARAYGHHGAAPSSTSVSPPLPDPSPVQATEPLPSSSALSTGSAPGACMPDPSPAAASGPGHPRRDAWSSWARQTRRLHRAR